MYGLSIRQPVDATTGRGQNAGKMYGPGIRQPVDAATGRDQSASLREFVLNSHHPDPRRAWKGGSEPRLLPPDPVDPVDPLDRRNEFLNATV